VPNFNFLNTKTDEEFTDFMSNSEREQFLSDNPHIQQIPSLTSIVDMTRIGMKKPDAAFRDILKDTKKRHVRSTINTW
jgi:hypothetical protein